MMMNDAEEKNPTCPSDFCSVFDCGICSVMSKSGGCDALESRFLDPSTKATAISDILSLQSLRRLCPVCLNLVSYVTQGRGDGDEKKISLSCSLLVSLCRLLFDHSSDCSGWAVHHEFMSTAQSSFRSSKIGFAYKNVLSLGGRIRKYYKLWDYQHGFCSVDNVVFAIPLSPLDSSCSLLSPLCVTYLDSSGVNYKTEISCRLMVLLSSGVSRVDFNKWCIYRLCSLPRSILVRFCAPEVTSQMSRFSSIYPSSSSSLSSPQDDNDNDDVFDSVVSQVSLLESYEKKVVELKASISLSLADPLLDDKVITSHRVGESSTIVRECSTVLCESKSIDDLNSLICKHNLKEIANVKWERSDIISFVSTLDSNSISSRSVDYELLVSCYEKDIIIPRRNIESVANGQKLRQYQEKLMCCRSNWKCVPRLSLVRDHDTPEEYTIKKSYDDQYPVTLSRLRSSTYCLESSLWRKRKYVNSQKYNNNNNNSNKRRQG
jgi:hypothetical protein